MLVTGNTLAPPQHPGRMHAYQMIPKLPGADAAASVMLRFCCAAPAGSHASPSFPSLSHYDAAKYARSEGWQRRWVLVQPQLCGTRDTFCVHQSAPWCMVRGPPTPHAPAST